MMRGPYVIAAAPGWRVAATDDTGNLGCFGAVLGWYIYNELTYPITAAGVLDPDTETLMVVSPEDDELAVLLGGGICKTFSDPEEAYQYLQERAEMRRAS